MQPPLRPIGEIVGDNVRRLRDAHGISMDQLARHARGYGLKWNTGRVYDVEHGGIPLTISLLLTLTTALAEASGQALRITDLTDGIDRAQLNDGAWIGTASLRAALSGQTTADWGIDRSEELGREITNEFRTAAKGLSDQTDGPSLGLLARGLATAGLTETRIAKDLGINLQGIVGLSAYLWNRTFTEERDERAGPNANAQKRGRVARELKAEIQQVLAEPSIRELFVDGDD